MEGKKVKESYAIIAQVMLPQDANPPGNVHGGVIMKQIDTVAGVVAVRHAHCNVVTASIDRLDFYKPVFIGNLLTLKASINMVGKTSMEVGVRVTAEDLLSGELRHIASAYLTFVALDEMLKPKRIPPLILESDTERRRNREATERRKMRLAEKKKEHQEI